MKHKRDNSLFAFMFSDLMMGGMAIVTVMLIFLSVVAVKGQGTVENVNLVDLPPGLLDSNSMPYVRIRLVACGSKIQRDGLHLDPPPDSTSISSSQQADCTVTLYQFPSGLEEHSVNVVSSREGETPETDVLVSVGGWHGYFELPTISAKAGQSLATISLRDPQRIFRRL
ncbi:hypothetical protein [Marinobacter segnicrescens]|uniref:hypothetical protein n=1 Tax=Marinobacter segnicrescens TaxID=430453 RepID=UPI003A908F7D